MYTESTYMQCQQIDFSLDSATRIECVAVCCSVLQCVAVCEGCFGRMKVFYSRSERTHTRSAKTSSLCRTRKSNIKFFLIEYRAFSVEYRVECLGRTSGYSYRKEKKEKKENANACIAKISTLCHTLQVECTSHLRCILWKKPHVSSKKPHVSSNLMKHEAFSIEHRAYLFW